MNFFFCIWFRICFLFIWFLLFWWFFILFIVRFTIYLWM